MSKRKIIEINIETVSTSRNYYTLESSGYESAKSEERAVFIKQEGDWIVIKLDNGNTRCWPYSKVVSYEFFEG